MDKALTSTIKTCPQCNVSFACSPTDCWCSRLPNIMPVSVVDDCLCPACLEREIAKKTD